MYTVFFGNSFYWMIILFSFIYCDRVEDNEKKLTILAKELRSLRRNVKSKISNLQVAIGTQNNYEKHYRYYEMKKLFKKVQDLKFLTLTLKLDVRQLFYEGLSLETKMKYFVTGKTKTLSNEIAELRASLHNIYNRTNISESWDLQSDVLPTNRTVFIASENTTDDVKSTHMSSLTTKAPLQTLDVSLELGKKLTVSCYRNKMGDALKAIVNPVSHWYHNGNRITSKDRRYVAEYSKDKNVVKLSIRKLKYKDTGVVECKEYLSDVLLRINLKVKEPCKDFQCDGVCVEWSRICDKNKDCPRGQDETFCELIADVTDGATPGRGTVVVLLNRMKGWVCYDGWDQYGTDVLCRSLGYSRGIVGNPRIQFEDRGFLVSNIECTGDEQSLAQCNRNITRVGSCQAIATALCMNK